MAATRELKTTNSVEEYDMSSPDADRMHASALGGTSHDAQDMYRMGKKQELRVSSGHSILIRALLIEAAKLPTYLNCRICGSPSIDMGECSLVSHRLTSSSNND